MPSFIKDFIRSSIERVFNIQITRVKKASPDEKKPPLKTVTVHDPKFSYMPQPAYREKLHSELSDIADSFLSQNYYPIEPGYSTKTIIRDFFELYSGREKTENTQGSGFHNAFWLYVIARTLNPTIIVESGVWKGHSSWLLSRACPGADKYGFDINLRQLQFHDLDVQMFQEDWGAFEFPEFDPERSLIFFDCHVNHAQRILEAKAKGFKHLLIDDNPPLHKIYSHIPGIPTAAMLRAGEGLDLTEISWFWNGEEITMPIDPRQAQEARKLIKHHVLLPDVGSVTRYGGFAYLTYVQL